MIDLRGSLVGGDGREQGSSPLEVGSVHLYYRPCTQFTHSLVNKKKRKKKGFPSGVIHTVLLNFSLWLFSPRILISP